MRLPIKLMQNAFHICGLYPLNNNTIFHKFHGHMYTLSLIFLIIGIACETIFLTEGYAKLLPFTYAICSMHALNKRFTLFYHEEAIKEFLTLIDTPYLYSDQKNMKEVEFSEKTLLLIYRIITSFLFQLFFFAYASPFFKVLIGDSLDYSVVMYPIYVPWKVETFPVYMITYFIQAILVCPALMGIYSTTICIVYSMILFKIEFDKICEAIDTLQSRTKIAIREEHLTVKNSIHGGFSRNSDRTLMESYETTYHRYLRECIVHYQQLVRTFEAFSKWYNLFFTAELIESTSTICLLFFCTLKMNDLSIFLNILSICFHVVVSLFFRCYTGEFFKEMNEHLKFTLYDITWYEQPPAIMKLFHMFHMHLKKPLMLYGFNHFPSSYTTFSGVGRISYSYCNFLVASLK